MGALATERMRQASGVHADDGSGHYTGTGSRADAQKNRDLENLGYTVVHYTNSDVWYNLPGVCEDIMAKCGE